MRGDSDSESFSCSCCCKLVGEMAENIVGGVEGKSGGKKWRGFVWLAGSLSLSLSLSLSTL